MSYLMLVPNFKILSQVVLEKSLTKNSIYHYLGVRDRKRLKIEKEDKSNSQHLGFVSSNTLGHTRCVYKI